MVTGYLLQHIDMFWFCIEWNYKYCDRSLIVISSWDSTIQHELVVNLDSVEVATETTSLIFVLCIQFNLL